MEKKECPGLDPDIAESLKSASVTSAASEANSSL